MGRLDTSDPAIFDAINDVKEHTTPTNFVVFKYVPKTDKLKVQEISEGDHTDMLDEMNDGQVQYVFIRYKVSEGYKFVYVAWCGEGVTGMLRGNFANHATDFENFLQKSRLGFHVRINARGEDDLDEDTVIKKINSAKGANFIKAGTRKQGTGPDLKKVSAGFWNEQESKDQAHAAAMQQHDAARLAALEESKKREEASLKQQADALLAEREREREQEHQQHMAGEAQRAKQWEQHQQQQLKKTLAEQEQMRMEAPQSQIGTAYDNKADAPEHNKYVAPEPAPSHATDFSAAPAPAPTPAAKPPSFGGAPAPGGGGPPPVAAKPASFGGDEGGYDEGGYDEGGYDEGGYDEGGYDEGYGEAAEGGFDEAAAAPAAPAGGLGTATAQYDYAGENPDDLVFSEGDVITILDNSDAEGWWQGDLNGVQGWFPSNFVVKD